MKKTTETMDGTKVQTNFDGESLNHWSWEGKITTEVIYSFLQYLCGLMQWLMTEGKTLLERETPLIYEEWKPLSEKAFNLWYQMDPDRPVCLLYMAAVKKGISSLTHAVKADPTGDTEQSRVEHWNKYHDWIWNIGYQLQPGARFGIGSRSCRVEESRELLESMVPVAQYLKHDHLIEAIARDRFPHEDEVQKLFIEKHKNWKW